MALTSEQHMLTKLAEEGCEISQIALKTVQFKMDEKRPDQPFTNKERIHQEINDLMGVIRVLNREHNFGYVLPDLVNDHQDSLNQEEFIKARDFNNDAVLKKEEKLKYYKGYSQYIGTVEKDVETVENIKVHTVIPADIHSPAYIGIDPAHPEGDKTVEHEVRKL